MNKLSLSTPTYVRTSRIAFIFCCFLMTTLTTLEMKAMVASNRATPTPFFTFSKAKQQMHCIQLTSIFAKEKMTKTKGEVAIEAVTVVLLILAGVFFLVLLGLALSCGPGWFALSCKNSAFFIGISIVGLFLVIFGIRKALRKKKRTS